MLRIRSSSDWARPWDAVIELALSVDRRPTMSWGSRATITTMVMPSATITSTSVKPASWGAQFSPCPGVWQDPRRSADRDTAGQSFHVEHIGLVGAGSSDPDRAGCGGAAGGERHAVLARRGAGEPPRSDVDLVGVGRDRSRPEGHVLAVASSA